MRFILSLLIATAVAIPFVSADDESPISGILNPSFASNLATVTTLNASGEEGVFVISPDGKMLISLLKLEIVERSNEQLGGFLTVYADTGQSLFELPNGGYQMQLSTGNGAIDFSYLNQASSIQAEERLTMEEDFLLAESEESFYQLYLLTTGELSVIIGPDETGMSYQITFTGIPALEY
jgi:hypothetical protein